MNSILIYISFNRYINIYTNTFEQLSNADTYLHLYSVDILFDRSLYISCYRALHSHSQRQHSDSAIGCRANDFATLRDGTEAKPLNRLYFSNQLRPCHSVYAKCIDKRNAIHHYNIDKYYYYLNMNKQKRNKLDFIIGFSFGCTIFYDQRQYINMYCLLCSYFVLVSNMQDARCTFLVYRYSVQIMVSVRARI